ncbi:MAG: VOC family protein [Desulfovibrio sp.]|nr:MAG: VOC family protein [Desulfovibrio sp.]
MNESSKEHGSFSWNELITTDLESAKEFYGELLGWTFTETKTIYGNPYLVALKGETVVSGMMLKKGNVPDDVEPCWDPYVTVRDVDASAKQVEELGGEVVLPPTEIPHVGRFCVIRDRQGVSLNLITYFENSEK